jgi:hypothetical protein
VGIYQIQQPETKLLQLLKHFFEVMYIGLLSYQKMGLSEEYQQDDYWLC